MRATSSLAGDELLGGSVADLMRIPLGDGGAIVVRAATLDAGGEGPVKAGRGVERVRDRVVEVSRTLEEMLAPVATMSRRVLAQLRESGPDSVEVEFGVELSAEAGAVLASTSGACHLQVTLTWAAGDSGPG